MGGGHTRYIAYRTVEWRAKWTKQKPEPWKGKTQWGGEEATKVTAAAEAATVTYANVSAEAATGVPQTEWHPSAHLGGGERDGTEGGGG